MENIATILELHLNPKVVTKLDFDFCYWVASRELFDFVKKCPNLKELSVAHSSLINQDLAEILAENFKISKLSFSLDSPETVWSEISLAFNCQNSWERQFSLSRFSKCNKAFARMTSLNLYMGQHPIILGTILR